MTLAPSVGSVATPDRHPVTVPAPLFDAESLRAVLIAAAERVPLQPHARLFPREFLTAVADAGVLAARWRGNAGLAAMLAIESGRLGRSGLGVGLSLHAETVCSMLLRYGGSDELRDLADRAVAGAVLGAVGISEPTGGSDVSAITTTATRTDQGWRVVGQKKYLTLGHTCDFALVLARVVDAGQQRGLAVLAVPADGFVVVKHHRGMGMDELDTAWVRIDCEVGVGAMLGRPGLGLAVATWGLTHERLSIAGQVVGQTELALGLAVAHLHRRTQFGVPLFSHQALRLRAADLSSQIGILRLAVESLGAGIDQVDSAGIREIAGVKVFAAHLAERVLSECQHMFGGAGYLEDETPLARLFRDGRLARIGAGTDEMMWELVASGLTPDDEAYDRLVRIPSDDHFTTGESVE